jgi:pyrophosphate--fructose-6-phosphate 1-phosphotransferase
MDLKSARLEYKPKVCEILKNILNISKVEEEKIPLKDNSLKKIFLNTYNQKLVSFKKDFTKKEEKNSPLKIAVVFSGGPAPGGHNVISAIFDSLKFLNV